MGGFGMLEQEMKRRTKQFALRIMRLVAALPRDLVARDLGRQLLRSGTSVGANYRSACRGRSRAEFASKVGVAEEEADESAYWLELVVEGQLLSAARVAPLLQEANELTAILAASGKTVRSNRKSKIQNPK
jgi:four helix bundle protein